MIKHYTGHIFVPGDLYDDLHIKLCHSNIFNFKCCGGNFIVLDPSSCFYAVHVGSKKTSETLILDPITGTIHILKENISFFDKEYTIEYNYLVEE